MRQQGHLCAIVAGSCTVQTLVRTVSSHFFELSQTAGISLTLLHEICAALGICSHGDGKCAFLLTALEACCAVLTTCGDVNLYSALFGLEDFWKADALACAASHGLSCSRMVASIKMAVYKHIFEGACSTLSEEFSSCRDVQESLLLPCGSGIDGFQISLLTTVVPCASQWFLVCLLDSKKLPYDATMSMSHLRRILLQYVQ